MVEPVGEEPAQLPGDHVKKGLLNRRQKWIAPAGAYKYSDVTGMPDDYNEWKSIKHIWDQIFTDGAGTMPVPGVDNIFPCFKAEDYRILAYFAAKGTKPDWAEWNKMKAYNAEQWEGAMGQLNEGVTLQTDASYWHTENPASMDDFLPRCRQLTRATAGRAGAVKTAGWVFDVSPVWEDFKQRYSTGQHALNNKLARELEENANKRAIWRTKKDAAETEIVRLQGGPPISDAERQRKVQAIEAQRQRELSGVVEVTRRQQSDIGTSYSYMPKQQERQTQRRSSVRATVLQRVEAKHKAVRAKHLKKLRMMSASSFEK